LAHTIRIIKKIRAALSRARAEMTAGFEESPSLVEAAPAVQVREIFRRFWPYARPYKTWLFITLIFVALSPAIEAATIWMYKILIDEVLVPQAFGLLVWVVLGYLGLTLLSGGVGFVDDYLSAWVSERFLVSLRTDFFSHLHGLSMHFFEREKLGDTLARLSDDVDAIEEFVLSGVTSAVSYIFRLLFFVGALFYIQWRLALVALLVAPLFWLATRYFSRRIRHASREESQRDGSVGAVAEESLSNAALVQAYNRQDWEVSRFHRENVAGFRAGMVATRLSALFAPLISLIEIAGVLVVIVAGVYELSQGRITIGGLLIFLVFLSQLYSPIRGLAGLMNTLYSASAGAERILEYLDRKPAVEEWDNAHALRRARGIVELDTVSFSYPGKDEEAISKVSFRASPGETVALVGASGAGKSTVAKLLLRFYDPGEGAVRLDGHDLRDLTLHSLRENVAVLLQEALVFDGSVAENIAYGREDATREEVVAAAKAADAHGFIEALSEGYDTVVGQKGRLLSGGQRQRIAIARAMVRDAPVLVLDEPTTGLDAESARKVMEPLRRLMAGRTTIIVSHNFSTTREADRIIVMDGGGIVEAGVHEDLMSRNGVYTRLYRTSGSGDKESALIEAGNTLGERAE
jgi:subfamily B ATP-binding cassette protein MsbA